MLFTKRASESNNSSEPPRNKRKIDNSTGPTLPTNLLEVNSVQEDNFCIQITNSTSEHCANCSVKFSVSESGETQTVKEFMSLDKITGEYTKVTIWKVLSSIYQLRIRMYNNIDIAKAFCLGEDGNRDLSTCVKCAMSLCRLYKSYIEFQEMGAQDSYISKLTKEKENTGLNSGPESQPSSSNASPVSISSSVPPPKSPPRKFSPRTVNQKICNQRPLNLVKKNKAYNHTSKKDYSPASTLTHKSTVTQSGDNNFVGYPLLKCGACAVNFQSQKDLDRHKMDSRCNRHQFIHSKTYICHLCSRDFQEIDNLNEHMKIHWEKHIYHPACACPRCGN